MTEKEKEQEQEIAPFVRTTTLWWLLVLAILAIALFLRLRHIDTTGIWSDQSFTLNTAMRWVQGGDIPLASNKSSVGFVNPPMIEYVYAVALVFWGDVLSVAYITMLSGLAAVALTGYGVYRIFGKSAAVWSMLFFAFNPWSVLYSQLIWNQTMVPFFATLTFVFLWLYVCVEQKHWYLLLCCASASCMTQVHPASAPQVFTIGLILLIFIRRINILTAVAGAILFNIIYIPYFIYEAGVGWVDLTAIRQISEQETVFSPASFLVSIDLLHAQGIPNYFDQVLSLDQLATIVFSVTVAAVFYMMFKGGPTVAVASEQSADLPNPVSTREALLVVFIWFAVPILFYLRSQEHLQVYYLINQFPTHFIIMGVGLAYILRALTTPAMTLRIRPSWIGAVPVVLPVLLLFGGQAVFSFDAQDRRIENPDGMLQIRHIRETLEQARMHAATYPDCTFAVLSEGHMVEISRLSLLREFGSDLGTVMLADAHLSLPLPDQCAIYLDARLGSRASNWLQENDSLSLGEVDLQNDRWEFRWLDTAAAVDQIQANGRVPAEDAVWLNGGELVAYDYSNLAPNEWLDLEILWQIVDQPDGRRYHIGTYLLDEESQVIVQADTPGADSIQWETGHHHLTWFALAPQSELPPQNYSLAVAFYTWPDVERAVLTNNDTTAYLEEIEIR